MSNALMAGGFAFAFLLLGCVRGQGASRGLVFKSLTIRLLVYGAAFIIGELYLIALFADLKWPRIVLYLAIVSWGVLIGSGVWYPHQRRMGKTNGAQN